ncbi:cytochrome P450 [Streptomyces pactum]|uniref:cytochrome P450 n=1 Tax=Streptomyces pactum TaxID=68249 RepID=UPI0036FEACC1
MRPEDTPPTGDRALPRAGAADALRVAAYVLLPSVVCGPVLRRRRAMAAAERLGWDRTGIGAVRRLRSRYGDGPLLLPFGRRAALVLAPRDAVDVLDRTPDPFSPASREKRAALAQFQPHGSLISRGAVREDRRRVNEDALDTGQPLHRGAGRLVRVVREEAGELLPDGGPVAELAWPELEKSWWRTVRRVVFGDAARDDDLLTDRLARLRAAANWSYLMPRHRLRRARFLAHLRERTAGAEPGSLAAALPPAAPGTDPWGQVGHWLFAFDAVGMTLPRTLALLAGHPEALRRATEEATAGDPVRPRELPYLRACVRETLRLWPTTPLLLRETVTATHRGATTVPAGTTFVLYTPYLHRSGAAGAEPDRFVPERWLGERDLARLGVVPFSAGPGRCPGEDVVLLLAATWLAAVLPGRMFRVTSRTRPGPDGPLPAGLDPFALRFSVLRPGAGPAPGDG